MRRLLALALIAFTIAAPVCAASAYLTSDQIRYIVAQAAPTVVPTIPSQTLEPAKPTPPVAIIDTGAIAGQVLTWVIATFGATIGASLTALLIRLAKKAGLQGADLLRNRLQALIVNGLNRGAAEAARDLAGHGKIEIKSAAVGKTVEYVQAHGADTLKALGLDPTSPATVEAIKARIESAIADPSTPTNPILNTAAQPPIGQQAGTQ